MKKISVLMFAAVLSFVPASFSYANEEIKVMEVKKGEAVPLTFAMAGDLVETTSPTTIELVAQRDLWVRISQAAVELSYDGVHFKSFTQMVSGSLKVGAQPNAGITTELTLKAK